MTTCEELSEYLAAYADGELEGDLREKVRLHLERCERCRKEADALAKVVALYRDAPAPTVAEGDWSQVSSALEAAMAETPVSIETVREQAARRRRFRWSWTPSLAAAAVLVIAVWASWDVFFGPVETTPTEPETPEVARVESLETGPDLVAFVHQPEDEDDLLTIDIFDEAVAQVDSIETGAAYEVIVRYPMQTDDVLTIDVVSVE